MKEKPLTEFIGKAKEKGENPAPKASALKGPWELPEGWKWVRLGDIIKEFKPGFARNKKHISEDGIPHLRPNNIGLGQLNLEKIVKVKLDNKINISEYYLREGDILFNNTNSVELVGRAVLITENLPWGYSNHITRIRVNTDIVTPKWAVFVINYLWMQGYFRRVCTHWVGQAGVNINTLKKTPIPFPPLPEQKRIVAKLDDVSRRLEEARRLVREAREEAEKLMASALHEVFSKAEERGWEWVRLGEISTIVMGQSPPSETYNTIGNGLPFYQGSGDFGEKYPTPRVWCTSPLKLAEIGDILISVRAPVGPVNIANEQCAIGRGLAAIRPLKEVDTLFLFYYLNYYEPMWSGSGSTFKAIRKKELVNLKIPLPLLEEQKCIVAYLDRISERAQRLVKIYEEREKELERLFPAILDRAFRGEL